MNLQVVSQPAGLPTGPLKVAPLPAPQPISIAKPAPLPAISTVQPKAPVPISVQPVANQPQLAPQVTTADNQPLRADTGLLDDGQKQALRGIVAKAVKDGQPPAVIQGIVNKYVQKYGGQDTSGGKSIGGFLENTVKSGVELAKNVAEVVAHPIKTLNATSDIISGGLKLGANKLGENYDTTAPDVQTAQAVGSYYKQRYGGVSNIGNTLYNDPLGVALDVATVADAGETAAAKLADVSKLGELGKAASVLHTVSDVTDPLNAADKAASIGGRAAGEVVGATTGTGFGAVKEGLSAAEQGGKAGKSFTEALRGNTAPEDIVTNARENLGAVKSAKTTAYKQAFGQLEKSTDELDTTPIKTKLAQSLDDFGVKTTVDKQGKPILNFKESVVSDPIEQARVKRIFDDVTTWQNNTPVGIDTLKRRIGSEFSQSSDVRAFTQGIKSEARQLLNDNVPGYEKMSQDYSKASDLISEMQKALSIGDKASMDTGIRKLTSILRQNNELRLDLVKRLQAAGGNQLIPQIAGTAFNSWLPRGILKPILTGEGIFHAGNIGKVIATFPALLLTSPRIVGEFINVLGNTKGLAKATQIGKLVEPAVKIGTQVQKSTEQKPVQPVRLGATPHAYAPTQQFADASTGDSYGGLAAELNKAALGQPKKIPPLHVEHTQSEMRTILNSKRNASAKQAGKSAAKPELDDLPRYHINVA